MTTPADGAGGRVSVRPASVGASADLMPKAAPGSVGAMEHGAIVPALGIEGISRSEVSRICAALDAEVKACRSRPLADTAYPYLSNAARMSVPDAS